VDSVEGQHTTFTVRLPFAGEQAGFQAPAQPSSPPDQVTFLVIDDLEATVKLLKSGLERENHTVFTALSGEDGLALLEAHIVDVVICDLGMPGMSGWQVGEAISERSLSTGRPKPKFIMLTGWADQAAETERIAAAKVDAIIEKPVDMAELLQVIRQVIRSD
jgi:two-component system repressor protein LuxO